MAPPATLTLGTVIDRIRRAGAMQAIGLGISQGVLELHQGVWRLIAVHGAVVGVSPHDDRGGERGATLYQTRDGEDMIDRLIGELWTSLYGAMLGPHERLDAEVQGVDPTALDVGQHGLDAKQARALSGFVREAGGTIRWTVTQHAAKR